MDKLWFVGSYNFFWLFDFSILVISSLRIGFIMWFTGILYNNNTCYVEYLKKEKSLSSYNKNVNDIFEIFIFQV